MGNTFFLFWPQTGGECINANSILDFLPDTEKVPFVCQLQRRDDTAQQSVQEKPQRILFFNSFILISHSFTILPYNSDVSIPGCTLLTLKLVFGTVSFIC